MQQTVNRLMYVRFMGVDSADGQGEVASDSQAENHGSLQSLQ